MRRREKLRGLAVVLASSLLLGAAACVSSLRGEPDPFDQEIAPSAYAYADQELVGHEVVLTDEEDEFGRPIPGPAGKAGEMLVAVGYVGVILAGIILPLLAL